MTEAYDGRQVVGMDLHRRRSVLVRMTEDGRKLETCRFSSEMALSQMTCRLNVACDSSMRKRRLARAFGDEGLRDGASSQAWGRVCDPRRPAAAPKRGHHRRSPSVTAIASTG